MTTFNDPPAEPQAIILYHNEEINLKLSNPDKISSWIKSVISAESQALGHLNFIFCSDAYLHKINVDYLNHDTYTDVITFPYSETLVEGDIFISIDRIRENAKTFEVTFEQELHRVIIHGVLHLMGYSDKTSTDKKQMTLKENTYLRELN